MPARPEANSHGATVYKTVCASCHDTSVSHAPPKYILELMSPEVIYRVLTVGPMRVQTQEVSDSDKRAVAEHLAGKKFGVTAERKPPRCQGKAAVFEFSEPPAYPAWGISYTNARYIPAATSGLGRDNVDKLKLTWAFGVPSGTRLRSHPTVAGGAIYVGTDDGTVHAFDLQSGCERWQFQAPVEVRTGILISVWKKGDANAVPLAYFGDLAGTVYAVNAITGALVWSDRADEHPAATLTGTPVLYKDRLYVPVSSLELGNTEPKYECCTFRGAIIAYDARSGKRLWKTYMMDQPVVQGTDAHGAKQYGPSGAAIWNAPAIDEKRGLLYFGTGNNYSSPANAISDAVVAVDMKTGKIAWSYQLTPNDAWHVACISPDQTKCPKERGPDADIGAAVILTTMTDGKQRIIVGQKSGWVYALDPDTHKIEWKTRVGRGGAAAGVYFGMAINGDALYVPINDVYDGRPDPEPPRPGLYALNLRDGSFLWKAPNTEDRCGGGKRIGCFPGIAAAATATDGLVLTGGSDGWVRIYDAGTGKILWRYDTTQSVETTSGGKAAGGSIGGATSPLPYHGKLIVVSGYGFGLYMPGSVMLVFDVK
jgi:polyvinyl alcohol dehydrogenase (cytochrome)